MPQFQSSFALALLAKGVATAASRAALAWMCLSGSPALAQESAASHVQFVEEAAGNCVARSGVQVLLKSNHPTRRIRVWLDRTVAGSGTGDRSRSELAPGAPPEALGCSRNQGLVQGWKLVRAEFVE
jgi:hypothetical protein